MNKIKTSEFYKLVKKIIEKARSKVYVSVITKKIHKKRKRSKDLVGIAKPIRY